MRIMRPFDSLRGLKGFAILKHNSNCTLVDVHRVCHESTKTKLMDCMDLHVLYKGEPHETLGRHILKLHFTNNNHHQ